MADVIPFPARNEISIRSDNSLLVHTTKVAFPWLELEVEGKTYRINATIDVGGIPPKLHQYLLLMMGTKRLVVPMDVGLGLQPREPQPKKPWWRFW